MGNGRMGQCCAKGMIFFKILKERWWNPIEADAHIDPLNYEANKVDEEQGNAILAPRRNNESIQLQ